MAYYFSEWARGPVLKSKKLLMNSPTEKKENPIQWLFRYIKESRGEMKKVSWPSKQDTMRYSIIVIALCVIVAAFFGGLDWLLALGLEKLIAITS